MKDITFTDLVVLEKLEGEVSLESFGGHINSSFFDTAAVMGTLQVKGLVSISSAIGHSTARRTKAGDDVLLRAIEKGSEDIDELDHTILKVIAAGARQQDQVSHELNVSGSDLAYHLFRLMKHGYMNHVIREGKVFLSLSEAGFKMTGFVPRKHAARAEEEKAHAKPTSTGHAHGGIETIMAEGSDILQRIPKGKEVKLTRLTRIRGKTAHYVRNNSSLILGVIILIIAIILAKIYLL